MLRPFFPIEKWPFFRCFRRRASRLTPISELSEERSFFIISYGEKFMKWNEIILVVGLLGVVACSDSKNLVVKSSGSKLASGSSSLIQKQNLVRILKDEGPAIGSPTSVTIKVYSLYIGASEDCTGLVLVKDYGAAGESKDFFEEGQLFSEPAAAGNYKCIAIKMSDNIRFKANQAAVDADTAACVSTETEHVIDIYRSDSGEETPWVDNNGAAVTATGSGDTLGDDTVVIFASTNPSAAMGRSTNPVHDNQLAALTAELQVPGQTTFYADGSDQITSSEGDCGLSSIELGFI